MLSRLSVSNRINIGFASLTAVLIAMAVFAYVAVSELGSTYQEYRATAKQKIKITAFVEDLFQARVASYKYRLEPTADRAADVFSNLEEVERDAKDLSVFAGSPEFIDAILGKLAPIDAYKTEFQRYSDLNRQRAADGAELVAASNVVQDTLAGISGRAAELYDIQLVMLATDAQMALLTGQIYAERLGRSEAEVDLTAAQTQFAAAQDALTAVQSHLSGNIRRATYADLSAQVSTIQGQLDSITVLVGGLYDQGQELTKIRTESLDRIGPMLQSGLEGIAETIVDRQDVLGPAGETLVTRVLTLTPLIGLCAVAISAFLAWLIGGAIVMPLKRLAAQTVNLSKGETDFVIEGTDHSHELGQMANALATFRSAHLQHLETDRKQAAGRQQQQTVVAQLTKNLQELANGALTTRVESEFAGEYGALKLNFNAALEQLEQTVTRVMATAQTIDGTATEISGASDELSQRTESQAATLEEASAALQNLTHGVEGSAARASEVEEKVRFAREKARGSESVVSNAVTAMSGIEQSSAQISRVTEVISDISFQTNLLALNAGVEAARAGEAGRGFAVVASEVGALAQRSADAVEEVSQLITMSTRQVSEGTKLVNEAGDALKSIIERVDEISELILDITNSASEQALQIAEINSGVAHLDQATQLNASMVERSGSQGQYLAGQARDLRELVRAFQVTGASRDGLAGVHGQAA